MESSYSEKNNGAGNERPKRVLDVSVGLLILMELPGPDP
jgi:hypothetical protein